MKRVAILVITLVLFAVCLPAFAAQFPDVPTDHWAYAAVQDLSDKGVVIGYPDGTFGGKRALTRYEFAQALARAIPVIAKMASPAEGVAGPQGPQGDVGPAGPPGVTPEMLANINKLMDEFKAELAAQGVDLQAVKKDIAALADRLAAVESEQQRVKISAEVLAAFRGTIQNSGDAFDKDGRFLSPGSTPKSNALVGNDFFNQIDLTIKGRVSKSAYVTALISAGDYLPFALGEQSNFLTGYSTQQSIFSNSESFNLYYLYLNAAVGLGPLGNAQATIGRFPFQLTPLTLKFIAPDSYIYNTKLQTGDYPLDGGNVAFKLGKADVNVFAADAVQSLGIAMPFGMFTTDHLHSFTQIAGARAVIGMPSNGSLGLTYYQAGMDSGNGQDRVYGADLKFNVARIGIAGEWAQSNPSDALNAFEDPIRNDDSAWYGNLSYKIGKLGIGGGYSEIGENYTAPGSWNRTGAAVNLTNIKGWNANLNYPITSKLALCADGQFLEPKVGNFVGFRFSGFADAGFDAGIDKITAWKAGVKYALTAANTVDLGMEEVQWKAIVGPLTREQYFNIGLGHTFSPNASMKLLYQIVDYKVGALDPYNNGAFRGGITTAEFLVKY